MSKKNPTLPELASALIEVVGLADDESESSISAINRVLICLQRCRKDGSDPGALNGLAIELLDVLGVVYDEPGPTPRKRLEAAIAHARRILAPGTPLFRVLDLARELGPIPIEAPIPMLLYCPECGGRHIDEGVFSTKPHHTHACQHCGLAWRPAILTTVGVRFLSDFKNEEGGQ